jgi:hypothetical protein
MTDKQIKCSCGKLIAIERDGKIYIKCKGCKHEIEIPITKK